MEEELDVPAAPLWHHTFSVTTAAGYKDNVLLSHARPEESPFLKGGLDFLLMRLPAVGPHLLFSVSGEDTRYFSSESVEKEQFVFTHGSVSRDFGVHWQASLGLDFFYFDQVLDISTLETNLISLKVRGEQLKATPKIRRDFSEHGAVELSFGLARHWYSAPIDDLWEYGPNLSFLRSYGHDSEWRLSFIYDHRAYDKRPRTQEDGTPVPGTTVALHQQRIELAWRHYFDEKKRWRATTRLGYKLNQDNGSGYFDYLRFQVAEQLRYRHGRCEFALEGRFGFYDYVQQRVNQGSGPVRERAEARVILRAERQIASWLNTFAEYEYEQVFANQDLEAYSVNVVTAGLRWEF